jgi:hypothetical protein
MQSSLSTTQDNLSNSKESQPCLVCGGAIGVVAGSKEAICTNCGYKDPCCE